jgi:ankyrin repeat protein
LLPGVSQSTATVSPIKTFEAIDPFHFVKQGDLERIQALVKSGEFDSNQIDSKGASPLLWAAGQGHLPILRYLVQLGCDVNFSQRGKRAFRGRTALHWAARNGHLEAVLFLLEKGANLHAATADGTTAFSWAAWQGHLSIMQFLYERGCDVASSNSFGCNAALWAAQGCGDPVVLEWLASVGCDIYKVNDNGHGILHKAAQRGRSRLCEWFLALQISEAHIGPDLEGCMPSDLAGMEGHEDLAVYLARQEALLAKNFLELPEWVARTPAVEEVGSICRWQAWAGVNRILTSIR